MKERHGFSGKLGYVLATAGSAVGGLIGMLVAVPIAAFLKIQFDKYIARKEAEKKAAASSN